MLDYLKKTRQVYNTANFTSPQGVKVNLAESLGRLDYLASQVAVTPDDLAELRWLADELTKAVERLGGRHGA